MANAVLSYEQVQTLYPNEWVLLHVLSEETDTKSGFILYHSKDYLELCYKSSEIAKELLTRIIYTGKPKSNRKGLKAIRLSETPKTI
jgi:hypothetical protein